MLFQLCTAAYLVSVLPAVGHVVRRLSVTPDGAVQQGHNIVRRAETKSPRNNIVRRAFAPAGRGDEQHAMAPTPVPTSAPTSALWPQIGADNSKCAGASGQSVTSQRVCQEEAVDKGQGYYMFTTSPQLSCATAASCDTLQTGTNKPWKIYQQAAATPATTAAATPATTAPTPVPTSAPTSALWPQFGADNSKCAGASGQSVTSQHDCQEEAVEEGHGYYMFTTSPQPSCATAASCDTLQTGTTKPWKIYQQAAATPATTAAATPATTAPTDSPTESTIQSPTPPSACVDDVSGINTAMGQSGYTCTYYQGSLEECGQTSDHNGVVPRDYCCASCQALTPAPQLVSGTGDPHLTNIRGQGFDVYKTGQMEFLRVPFESSTEGANFSVLATIEPSTASSTSKCTRELYIASLKFGGAWLMGRSLVILRAGGKMRATLQDVPLKPSPEQAISENVKFHMHTKKYFQVVIGSTLIDVIHRPIPVHHLDIHVKSLQSLGCRIGGLLGDDDHKDESTCAPGLPMLMDMATESQGSRASASMLP